MVFGRAMIAASVVASALVMPMTSASAGFLDFLFGGGSRRSAPVESIPPAPSLNSFAVPSGNGKTVGGMARMDVKSDPTLRAGDIVATNQGLMSYRGGNGKSADFTPVQDRKLAEVKIRNAPVSAAALAANARAEEQPPRDVDEPGSKKSKRRAQR